MSGWETNQVEHTFSTGRTAIIRRAVPLQWLVLRSLEDGDAGLASGLSEFFTTGTIATPEGAEGATEDEQRIASAERMAKLQIAGRVERAVLEAMFIRPRVYWDPEDIPPGDWSAAEGEIPMHAVVADLADSELTEVLELALKGVADAARFREEPDGADGGADGAGVGKKPKQRARAGAGKR